jgi:two-component system sensor histidine kinase BarA
LAIASEYGMKQNSRELLKRLLGLTHRKNSAFINSIAVFTDDNQLFVTSNFHRGLDMLRLPKGEPIPELTSVDYQGDCSQPRKLISECAKNEKTRCW